MSHVTANNLHGYVSRGFDVRVDVDTDLTPGDFSGIEFRAGEVIEKTGLSGVSGGSGVVIDFTLTAAEMAVAADTYPWECVATVSGEVRTLARGFFTINPELTEETP